MTIFYYFSKGTTGVEPMTPRSAVECSTTVLCLKPIRQLCRTRSVYNTESNGLEYSVVVQLLFSQLNLVNLNRYRGCLRVLGVLIPVTYILQVPNPKTAFVSPYFCRKSCCVDGPKHQSLIDQQPILPYPFSHVVSYQPNNHIGQVYFILKFF